MAILKTRCPECNAGLKSPTGFTVGQTVCCPKCETYFAVEEPEEDQEEQEQPKKAATAAKGKATGAKKPLKAAAIDDGAEDEDEDEDEKPVKKKKKKKKSDDDDEDTTRSYKNSPLRFVVLGVLVVVMLVLGYMLYEKRTNEKVEASAPPGESAPPGGPNPAGGPLPIRPGPGVGIPIPPGGGKLPPGGGKLPPGGGKLPPGGGGVDPVTAMLGGGPIADPQGLLNKYRSALVGTWTADLGDGATEEITYTAAGAFTAKVTGPAATTSTGKYTVKGLSGSKGLKVQLDTAGGSRTISVLFDGNELEHPSLQPGVTGTFRKK